PGVVLPGLVGATALILFAFSASILPVSAVGLLLIALAVVMFILEVKVVSYGMLTLGGAVSLVFGGILLIDGPIPELRVPPGVIVPVAVMLTILIAFVMRLVMRAHRAKVATGEEGLVGETGPVRVTIDSTHNGRVWIHGELWSAVSSSETIEVGQSIRVVAVDGMRLTVETVAEEEQ
ncbi:MAG: nodulation protein NfeD, partial [Acidobacteriota bacterium]|nr:nodulation protein NfeD [Acidobacteriota bacterium]